jgi:hypothetical protein
LAHDRRRIVPCNVTAHPTAEWTGQQLREAFPFDQLPRYLLRDRDAIFGDDFPRGQVRDLGIQEVLCAPRSPWQNVTTFMEFEPSIPISITITETLQVRPLPGSTTKRAALNRFLDLSRFRQTRDAIPSDTGMV